MAGGWETALGLGLCLAALHRGGECSPWGAKIHLTLPPAPPQV